MACAAALSVAAQAASRSRGVTAVTVDEWRERLRSNLVDFVAESRFGWGQNRDSPG